MRDWPSVIWGWGGEFGMHHRLSFRYFKERRQAVRDRRRMEHQGEELRLGKAQASCFH